MSYGFHMTTESENASMSDLTNIVPCLMQLFNSCAILAWQRKEKAVLEKEDALLRKNVSRARALPATFPALVDTLQGMKDSPTGLQKLDAELAKQQAICAKIADELRAMLRAASCAVEAEKAMKIETQLKEEWKAQLKEEVADAEKRLEAKIRSNVENELRENLFSDLKEQLLAESKVKQSTSGAPNTESQDAMAAELQEQFGRLENSVSFVSTSNRNLSKQIARVEKWQRDVEEGRIRLSSQSEIPAGSSREANIDLEKLKGQIAALETRLSQIERRLSDWPGASTESNRETNLDLKDLKERILALEIRLGQVEQWHHGWSDLKSQVKENAEVLDLIRSARGLDHEPDQLKIATLETQLQQIQRDLVARLQGFAEVMRKHGDAIADLPSRIEDCQKLQETMAVALRSLEHRYSNINSEELVKSMTNAMYYMYPDMQKVHEQLKSLQVQLSTYKAEVTEELNRVKNAMDNEHKAPAAAALQDLKQISEQVAQHEDVQKGQAADIVRHLEEVTELRNQLGGYSLALTELVDKQADDVSDLFGELKAFVPRFDEYDTRLESQATQCKDLEEFCQIARAELDTIKEVTSKENITRTCEDAVQAIVSKISESNWTGVAVLKRTENIQHRLSSLDPNSESRQHFNEFLFAPDINGSSATPLNTDSWKSSDRPRLPAAAQAASSAESLANAPHVPTNPRAMMPEPGYAAPSPGAAGGPLRIKGVASENDSARGQTNSDPHPSPRKNSRDTPMSSRVTASPPSPTVPIPKIRNATTGQEHPTTGNAASKGASSNPSTQAAAGNKRPRQPTISDDESRAAGTPNTVLSSATNPSPAPSPASDVSLMRKSKKARKKEKRQQSQLN